MPSHLAFGVAALLTLSLCGSLHSEPPASHPATVPDDLLSAPSSDDQADPDAARAPVIDPNGILPEAAAPAQRPIPRVRRPTLDEIVNTANGVYLTKFNATDPHLRQKVTAVLRHTANLGAKPVVGKFLPNSGFNWVGVPSGRNSDEVTGVTIVFAASNETPARKMTTSVNRDTVGTFGVTVSRLTELIRDHDSQLAKH